MEPVSVEILHSGGPYPRLVEEYLASQGAPVTSVEASGDWLKSLEEEKAALPAGLGQANVLIAIALPPTVLAELPRLLAGTKCRALLVPVEDPNWVRPGLAMQVQRLCTEAGLEGAVAAPFCSLVPGGDVIRAFCEQYHIGRPWLKLALAEGKVTECSCRRGSPCGLTHWLAERLAGTPVEEVVERAQTLHHARPCLATMVLVPEIGDTLMHVSMNLIKQAVSNARRRAEGSSAIKQRP